MVHRMDSMSNIPSLRVFDRRVAMKGGGRHRDETVRCVAALNDLERSNADLEADLHHGTSEFCQEGIPELVGTEKDGREHSTHIDMFDEECRWGWMV